LRLRQLEQRRDVPGHNNQLQEEFKMSTYTRLRLPSPAVILSCVALFAALGGGAYAAAAKGSSGIHFTKATLKDGWKSAGGPPGYAKDSLGVVHLRGAITAGSDSTVALVLPKAMRPHHNMFLPVYTTGVTMGLIEVFPNGGVMPIGGNDTGLTSLDGISFVAGE
jgi:hypothetical protein